MKTLKKTLLLLAITFTLATQVFSTTTINAATNAESRVVVQDGGGGRYCRWIWWMYGPWYYCS
ncbi:MAG: hypothetical protein ACRCUP_01355 [Mycoplasmatales bacterium]